jgi:uncharacterized protein YjdB
MNRKKRIPPYVGMALICALALFGACQNPAGNDNKPSVPVTEVTISPASTSVDVGKTVQLTAVVKPDNATNKTLTWTSSDNAVAKVDNTGLVTGVSAGTAVITATSVNGIADKAAITVTKPVPLVGISLAPNQLDIAGTGNTGSFTVTYNPADTTEKGLAWSSSNTAVATVNAETGLVTAVSAGDATITATSTVHSNISKSATVKVTVIDITGIALNEMSLNLNTGDNETLTVTYDPANTTETGIVWTSDNEAVATVSGGKVTAVGGGTAKITAKSTVKPSLTATCDVTVMGTQTETVLLTGISLPATHGLPKGQHHTLTVTYDPDNTTEKGVTWTSSNPGVATVDSATGDITAVSVGETTITATSTAKPSLTAACKVTVTIIKPTAINLLSTDITIGQQKTLTETYTPDNTTEKGVTWASSHPAIVEVDSVTGDITGKAVGTATITATSTADNTVSGTCTVNVLPVGATINVEFKGVENETIVLDELVHKGDMLNVTAPAGFDQYRWYVDSNSYAPTTSPTTTLPVWSLSLGLHYLTVIVDKGGNYFSMTVAFTVGY